MRGTGPEQALFVGLLREFIVEACFEVFKTRELARLPCSYCGKYCKNYGTGKEGQPGGDTMTYIVSCSVQGGT